MDLRALSKEESTNAVKQIINNQKLKIIEEQQAKKEVEEKLFNERQSRIRAEQRLTEKEALLSRKCEEIEHLEYKIETLQRKYDDLDHIIRDKVKRLAQYVISLKVEAFLGKCLVVKKLNKQNYMQRNQRKKLKQKPKRLVKILSLLWLYQERIHAQIFDLKKEKDQKEELYEKEKGLIESENEHLKKQYEDAKLQINKLATQLIEGQNIINERQKKIDEILGIIQNQESSIKGFKEKIILQNASLSELNSNLHQNQEEFKKYNQESLYLQETARFIRESLRNLIAKLELHEEQRYQIEVQDVLKEIKALYDSKFAPDIDKEKRKLLIKTEQQISQEILSGQLRSSMRLERQNGKIIQVNQIFQDSINIHPQAFEVFEKAKEKMLKLGKINEALEKKNKILQDKVNVLEQKKTNQGA